MTYGVAGPAAEINDHLARCLPLVERLGGNRWDFALANSRTLLGTARLDEEWLLLDVPLGGAVGGVPWWKLLEWNGWLTGAGKFALLLRPPSVHLRAEVALDEEFDLAARLRQSTVPGWRRRSG